MKNYHLTAEQRCFPADFQECLNSINVYFNQGKNKTNLTLSLEVSHQD